MAFNKAILVCVAIVLLVLVGSVAFWSAQLSSEPPPNWRGLVPGKSTEKEVVALLGRPYTIQRGVLASVYVYRESGKTFCDQRVTVGGGIVQAIEECTLLYATDVLLPDLVGRYGKPDLMEWSRTGPEVRVVVFSHSGVLAEVVALPLSEAPVIRILYSQPRCLLRVVAENWARLSRADPFPGSDVVGPKDPSFGTSKDCRRICNDDLRSGLAQPTGPGR